MLTMTRPRWGTLQATQKSFLSKIELFKRVPLAALQEVERRIVEKRYAKGHSIFLEKDPAGFVWFIKQGHVKEIIHTLQGRDLTLSMTGPQGLFGTSAFDGKEYSCQAVAETDATVVAFPIGDFLDLMGKYPGLARAVVERLSKLLRQSQDMHSFAQENVEKRILHVLMSLMGEFGSTIPLTRREIAEMAGTAVETSIRTFSRLEEEGLVVTARGKIILKNLQGIREHMEVA